jgi:hypothetical protein
MGHLGLIQGIIGRLASFCATVKNFCFTIVAGAVTLKYTQHESGLLWIAAAAVLLFCALDVYYLALERGFRGFYDEVARRPLADAGDVKIPKPDRKIGAAVLSPSIWPFYFPQILVVGILFWHHM